MVALYETACARSRAAAATFSSLDETATWSAYHRSPRGPFNLRWIYLHLIEHTVEHAAHIDLFLECDRGRARQPSPGDA